MARKPIFYSFHFSRDVMRVQLIRNIGSIVGNPPVSPNAWETIKRSGDDAVKKWIDDNMKYKQCVVVLIGEETSERKWVDYEIRKAWNEKKPMIGIYIHNIKCARTGISRKGENPFSKIKLNNGKYVSDYIKCHDPSAYAAYRDISDNIDSWINNAYRRG